jgi:hypothetical protein
VGGLERRAASYGSKLSLLGLAGLGGQQQHKAGMARSASQQKMSEP